MSFKDMDVKPVCWNQERHLDKCWKEAWAAWAKVRNLNHAPKDIEKYLNAFLKADKELKTYVERVYG